MESGGLRVEIARLDVRIDSVESIQEERDKRYSERDIANKDSVRAALAAIEKSSEKTEAALKEYKTGANEWRATVTDITARMPTNAEVDRRFDDIVAKIDDLKASRDAGVGMKALWGWIVGALGLLIAAATLLLKLKGG